jgi:hypothetical protein
MKWFVSLAIGLLISSGIINAHRSVAGNLRSTIPTLMPIYDGRNIYSSEARSTNTEKASIEQEFQRNLALIKQNTEFDCASDPPEISIVATAEGAFTKPNAKQKAFLYEKCRPGRVFGLGGLIIVEGNTIVAHQIYGENGCHTRSQPKWGF